MQQNIFAELPFPSYIASTCNIHMQHPQLLFLLLNCKIHAYNSIHDEFNRIQLCSQLSDLFRIAFDSQSVGKLQLDSD